MSGSFDQPPGWPDTPAATSTATPRARATERFQALRATSSPTGRSGLTTGRADAGAGEPRTRRGPRNVPSAPIVPAGSVTGRSLTLVITIMCFLASLTAGAVYMMNHTARQWMADIASEVTVQIEARERTDVDKLVADVVGFLSRQPGVAKVRALSVADTAQLLEPWLGQGGEGLSALPVPRLVAVELDRLNPPNIETLRAALGSSFARSGVTMDDHRRWQRQIRTITRSFALGGFAILFLVGAATTAIIVSATKSAMASNRDIVEVLHFVGATDRFIAREFERHFLRLGVRAGIVGAVLAVLVFIAIPGVMELMGGGAVTIAELTRLVGITSLDLWGYLLLGIVVLVIAAMCMLTSRIGVYRILNSRH
jgi:cell division transport system permease protein